MKKDDTEARNIVGADDDDDDDIEFTFVVRDFPESSVADAGIETEDGRVFPLFDCSLLDNADAAGSEKEITIDLQRLMEEREVYPRSDSASSVDDLDAVAAGGNCAWTPPSVPPLPERCKKSRSTGSSSSLRLRLRDLVLGRSHSDGKEKFVFLAPTEKKKSEAGKPAAVEKGKERKATEVSLASLHRLYYDKAAAGGGGARKSSLPYKQDIVGILGLGRSQHFN